MPVLRGRRAREIIEYFNSTLRPGERERALVRVEVDAGEAALRHEWRKTNAVTLRGRGHMTYDAYRCEGTGKGGSK